MPEPFEPPASYRTLADAGRLQYGRDRDEWTATWRQRALEDPPALLCVVDEVEWFAPDSLDDWVTPSHWRADLPLVPFAKTGAGDLWCWYGEWTDQATGESAVVLAEHDMNETMCFAPSFPGFVLRHLLQACARTDQRSLDRDGFTPADRLAALRANVAAVAPALPPGGADELQTILARPFREIREDHETWEDHWWSLVDDDEVAAILDRLLDTRHLDETFRHQT